MRLTLTLPLMALTFTITLSAADPRLGTWTVVSTHVVMDPIPKLTITQHSNVLHFVNSGTSDSEYAVQFDGNDYPVKNSDTADQVAIRRVDANTLDRTFKKKGRVVSTSRCTVTGNELRIVAPTETGESQTSVFDRSGGPRDTSDPFVGEWTLNPNKEFAGHIFKYEPAGKNGVQFSGPYGFGYTAQFDGKPYPALNSRDETVTVKIVDTRHIEETWMRHGKIGDFAKYAVSANGLDMTVIDDGVLPNGTKIHDESHFRKQ